MISRQASLAYCSTSNEKDLTCFFACANSSISLPPTPLHPYSLLCWWLSFMPADFGSHRLTNLSVSQSERERRTRAHVSPRLYFIIKSESGWGWGAGWGRLGSAGHKKRRTKPKQKAKKIKAKARPRVSKGPLLAWLAECSSSTHAGWLHLHK